jgi:hypothetical protein
LRLFQNFSFWNSFFRFNRKTWTLTGFSKSLSKTNRVLEQAQLFVFSEQSQQNLKKGQGDYTSPAPLNQYTLLRTTG